MSQIINDSLEISIGLSASRTKNAYLFSAFEYGEVLTFSLHLSPMYTADEAFLLLERDEDGKELSIRGTKKDDGFVFTVETNKICAEGLTRGLFYYVFEVGKVGSRVISQNEYGEGYVVGGKEEYVSRFQLSVYEKGTNKETGYEGGIMYQIFPDRFYKSGRNFKKKGAVMEKDWYALVSEYNSKPGEPIANNHFFGGDLFGIAEKLDYLKSLGVTLLYLNPIFKSASNHRYDTGDYGKVDELLGGEEGLSYLLEKCKEKKIGVILDGVFNHTGSDSLYFNKEGNYRSIGAYQSKSSPFYDWYFFKEHPDLYECWWGVTILPKVNCENESYREYIAGKNGIIEKYLQKGVLGFRLDVADELNDRMLDEIRARSRETRKDALIYGEVWEDASNKIAYSNRRHYFTGGQMNGVMNYPLKNALIAFLTEKDAEFLFYSQKILYNHYPKAVSDMQMNLLSSHDTERILTALAGCPDGEKENAFLATAKLTEEERRTAKELLKKAVVIQMFLPGIPCIYYGDEIGMEGYKDPFNRQTYKWGSEDEELLSFYKKITALRKSLPMLGSAYYRGLCCKNGVFSFERFEDTRRLVVTVNLSNEPYVYEIAKAGRSLLDEKEVINTVLVPSGEASVVLL